MGMGSTCHILHLSGTVRGRFTRLSFTCGCKGMVEFCGELLIAIAAEEGGFTAPAGLTFQVINPWCESSSFYMPNKNFCKRLVLPFFNSSDSKGRGYRKVTPLSGGILGKCTLTSCIQ